MKQYLTNQINMASDTSEREAIDGILELPTRIQRIDNRFASNQFVALMEEDEIDHGGCP